MKTRLTKGFEGFYRSAVCLGCSVDNVCGSLCFQENATETEPLSSRIKENFNVRQIHDINVAP